VAASVAFDSSESAILARVLAADHTSMSAEMARYFLRAEFPARDRKRMNALAENASRGSLSAEEQAELENYCHVGELLGLMQSQARRVLQAPECKS
jgi:hypothetical protein